MRYAQMRVVAALWRWRKLETGGKSPGDIITLTTDIGDMGESRGSREILTAASLPIWTWTQLIPILGQD